MKKYITKQEFDTLWKEAEIVTNLLNFYQGKDTDQLMKKLDEIHSQMGMNIVPDYIHGVIDGGKK